MRKIKINKIKTLFLVMIAFTISLLYLVGCSSSSNKTKLSTPIVLIYKDTITWNNIKNADKYIVLVDGNVEATVTTPMYELNSLNQIGQHSIQVYAISNNSSFLKSERSKIVSYTVNKSNTKDDEVFMHHILQDGQYSYNGLLEEAIEFEIDNQVKKTELWDTMVDVFYTNYDNEGGYCCEFWGKTMRGACLSYAYTQDTELYSVLETTVIDLLGAQDNEGRISSYDKQHEFTGWDVWGRNNVIRGLQYFYKICKSEELKQKILDSQKAQVDYLIEHIGPNEGQIDILDSCADWGGCTATPIGEAVTNLYMLTGVEKYFEFAKYIIESGGSSMVSSNGNNILEEALAKTPIYLWGMRKICEANNYFEGVFNYYLITGEEWAKQAYINFYNLLVDNEITIVGAVGTDVEEANHAVVEQADPSNVGRMQEACAYNDYIKLSARVFELTGDSKIIDRIEQSYYNIMLGGVNWCLHHDFVAFSYSPLNTQSRTSAYSGTSYLPNGTVQGCCITQSLFGLNQIPRVATTTYEEGVSFNLYLSGEGTFISPNGNNVNFITETNYPVEGNTKIKLGLSCNESFTVQLRIPEWSKTTKVLVNGIAINNVLAGEYCSINREWANGDTIEVILDMRTYLIHALDGCSNSNAKYNVAIKRGPIVFARDSRLEGDNIFEPLSFYEDNNGYLDVEVIETNFKSQLGLNVRLKDNTYVQLVDYGSAGKTESNESIMCTWIPTVNYWSIDFDNTKYIIFWSQNHNAPQYYDATSGHFTPNMNYVNSTNKELLKNFAFKFESCGNDEYYIYSYQADGYITVADNNEIIVSAKDINNEKQHFRLKQLGLYEFQIVAYNDMVFSQSDGELIVYQNLSHIQQSWHFVSY